MNSFSLVAKFSHFQFAQTDYDVLNNQNLGIKKVSPRERGNYSLAMTLQDHTLYIPKNHQEKLNETQNVLMFKTCPDFDKFFLDFGNETANYIKMLPNECGLPNSLATKQGQIDGCLFKYKNRDPNVVDYTKITVKNEDIKEKNVWLNPLILSLPIMGEQLAEPINQNVISINQVLHKQEQCGNDNIFFEPHLERDFDGRVAFLAGLNQKIREQNRQLSAIETLFLVRNHNAYIAFLALDSLGGAFEIRDYGDDTKFIWYAPKNLSPNGKKLVNALVSNWGGLIEGEKEVPIAVPAPQRVPKIYTPIWESVRSVSETEADDIDNSAVSALNIVQNSNRDPQTIIAWLHDLMSEYQELFKKCHIGHYRLKKIAHSEKWDFSYDILGFCQNFSERFLAPQSPVLIKLPILKNLDKLPPHIQDAHQKYESGYIDIVNSLDYGARSLLVRIWWPILGAQLKQNKGPENPPQPSFPKVGKGGIDFRIELPYDFGWAWQWYQLLYNQPIDAQISLKLLPKEDSAIVGYGQVGKVTVGKEVGPTAYRATTPIRL